MHSYIVIGGTRQGKSRKVKSLICSPVTSRYPCFVFDVMNEYGEFYWTDINGVRTQVRGPNLPTNQPELPRSRYADKKMNMSYFIEIANEKTMTNVVFEEATGFFSNGKIGETLIQMVVGRFHSGNSYIFVFHTIRSVPPILIENCNYVILFKTADNVKLVDSKYENPILSAGFRKQFAKPDKSPPEILRIQ